MSLTEKQKRHLKGLAHSLKPIMIVGGSGITEAFLNELDLTLEHHELIKVRVNAIDREERDQMIAQLCGASNAVLIQRIGHIAIIYRTAEEPKISLPK